MKLNLNDFVIVEDIPQSNLSIKLVIPSGCTKKCPFCFNQLNKETKTYDKNVFLANFQDSLLQIVKEARRRNSDRSISLDITGNEPTNDIKLFDEVIRRIWEIKPLFNKIVLTTNGQNLLLVDDLAKQVLDIVNISVHHYDREKRCKAFGTSFVFNQLDYKEMISSFGLWKHFTCICVLYEKLDCDFKHFVFNLVGWARGAFFDDIRLRSNFYKEDEFFTDYINDDSYGGDIERKEGLTSKVFYVGDMQVTMLQGVESLVDHVVGVEAVVDDNGLPYLDYGKQYPFSKDYIEHIYIKKPNLINLTPQEND
jgi:uncharacterized Fe-S cluster-containing radical SAM superfamily protein